MPTSTARRLALAAALLLPVVVAPAQQPAPAAPTAAELKKSFARIASGTEGESDDFDRLVARTARRLVAYLKTHDLTAAQAKQLGLDYAAAADGGQRVYTYSYGSGGTRGTIDRPVLQWRNAAGQRFAYSAAEECNFYEVHRLTSPGRTQYLLLGQEKGDSACDVSEAFVVELKGNYLLLDQPAFGKQASFRLCNVPLTFEAGPQALRLDLTDYSTEHDDKLLPEWGRPAGKAMTLYFRNGRFGRTR